MPGLETLPDKPWGKSSSSVVRPVLLARGTLESVDIAATRRLAETLGFDCVAPAPDRLMLRHRSDRTNRTYWVLEVRAVPEVRSPQHVSNHWGIWVPTRKDVDDAYALLSARAVELGLVRVQKPRPTHEGARDYSFYFEDASRNWWEIGEHPDEDEFMELFGHGDWDAHGEGGP
jgi:Glyoxalase/Bleomycin resistance protein/Dioxygenase superfamily